VSIQAVLLANWAVRAARSLSLQFGLVRGQVRQRAAQAFVADDLLHAENLWRDFVAA
jgi:hypothetical protein